MDSPGFSKFRSLMDVWDQYLAEEEELDKFKGFIDGNGLVLFFKKGSEYFGAGEDSRVVFARLKKPDEDVTDGWADEASFTAINLSKLAAGMPVQHVFDQDDVKKIKVMDKEDVIRAIKDDCDDCDAPIRVSSLRIFKIGQRISHKDRDDAPNFVRADEE